VTLLSIPPGAGGAGAGPLLRLWGPAHVGPTRQ